MNTHSPPTTSTLPEPQQSRKVRGTGPDNPAVGSPKRRTAIVRSAVRTFATHGFRESTTKRLARDAGISEALLYRYFRGKQDLQNAVLDHIVETFRAVLPESGPDTDDREFLASLAQNTYRQTRENPREARVIFQAALQGHPMAASYFDRQFRQYYRVLEERIQRGQAQGRYRDVSPRLAARGFLGMVNYHVMIQVIFGDRVMAATSSAWADEFISIFLEGIRR